MTITAAAREIVGKLIITPGASAAHIAQCEKEQAADVARIESILRAHFAVPPEVALAAKLVLDKPSITNKYDNAAQKVARYVTDFLDPQPKE